MNTRKYYSSDEALQLARYLHRMAAQGKPIDYEIRMDNLVAVPRNNDPQNFYNYQELQNDDTREMTVLFYKGASRVADKHVLVLSDAPLAPSIPTFEQQLESALEKDRTDFLIKFERDKLIALNEQKQRKISKLKRKIKRLKQTVSASEAESAGLVKTLKDIASSPKVKDLLNGSNSPESTDLGSLPDQTILNYLKDYLESLGEQTFQELLGTMLTIAQRPELIPQVRDFINDQTNNV